MIRIGLLLWCVALLVTPSFIHAQTISTDLSINAVPTNPSPGQTVTITATSYGADLSSASIVWTYNNSVIAQGTGKTTVSLAAPAAGLTGVVTVGVSGVGIEPTTQSIVLRPASIDLLWEAVDAYTPPFYKGKALLPLGGAVRVSAISAHNAPNTLSYQWSRNNSAVTSDSGVGKSSSSFNHDPLNGQEKVDVTVQSGSYASTGTIRINPYSPLLIGYANKEGFVDYSKGFTDTIALRSGGVVLRFEPYYFSVPSSLAYDLSFETELDGARISPSQQNEIGISSPETQGQSILRIAITTVAYTLQHLERTITLTFN